MLVRNSLPVSELPFSELPLSEVPLSQLPVSEMPLSELGEVPIDQHCKFALPGLRRTVCIPHTNFDVLWYECWVSGGEMFLLELRGVGPSDVMALQYKKKAS